MRYIVLTTALTFIGGLFTAGLVLGAGESQWGSSSQMEKGQQQEQYGGAQRGQQQQQMAGQQLEKEQVQELQKKLNEKGFSAGPVDGIVGPKTRGAIRSFQKQEGIAATGQPDQQTLEALDIEAQEFFGVSPEFGEEQQQKQIEEQQRQQMEQQQQQQEPYQQQQQQRPGSMETR